MENLSAPGDRLGVTPDLAVFVVFGGLLPVSPGQSQQPVAWEKRVNGCWPQAGTAEMLRSGKEPLRKQPGCGTSIPSSHPAGLAPWLCLGTEQGKGRARMQLLRVFQIRNESG